MSIGLSVIGRRHPRLAHALALIFAVLFAVYAVGLAIASAVQFHDAQQWAHAKKCNTPGEGCYQSVSATYLGSSTTGNKGELSVQFDVAGQGQRDVLVIGSEATTWQHTATTKGEPVALIQWSGRFPAISMGDAWIRTEDYPAWDLWNLAAPGSAVAVTLILLWFAREIRQLVSPNDAIGRIELA